MEENSNMKQNDAKLGRYVNAPIQKTNLQGV